MIKSDIIDKSGKSTKQIELPKEFSEKIRKDIVLRVFEAKKYKQPYGPYIFAGKLYSASGILRRKRHSWKGTYGRAISRSPRKIMSRNGSNFNWVGATAAYTRGGRPAHPPKVGENQFNKVNKKEFEIAFNSSLTGTIDKSIVEKRYNIKISHKLPIIVNSELLKVKTGEFIEFLKKVYESTDNILKEKKVRSGRGKTRGRKYKTNSGLLLVIGDKESFDIKGIDVVNVKNLKIEDLSPNGEIGRIVIYTEEAIKEIGKTK